MYHRAGGRSGLRAAYGVSVMLVLFLLFSGYLLSGCGRGSDEGMKEEYRAEYKEVMDGFESRVNSDDKKVARLAAKNDIAGLINLNKRRIAYINRVLARIMGFDTPSAFYKVQAITLYYLVSILDQLEAQNDYWEAVVLGNPSEDLKTIAETNAKKVQAVGIGLGVELQKAGIELKSLKEIPRQSTPAPTGGGPESSGSAPRQGEVRP